MDLLVPLPDCWPFHGSKLGARFHRGRRGEFCWTEAGLYGKQRQTAVSAGFKSDHAQAVWQQRPDAFKVSPKVTTSS